MSPPLTPDRHDSQSAPTELTRADTTPHQPTGRWGREASSSVGAAVTLSRPAQTRRSGPAVAAEELGYARFGSGRRTERRVPILLAALAPSPVRLAGELADCLGPLANPRRSGPARRGRSRAGGLNRAVIVTGCPASGAPVVVADATVTRSTMRFVAVRSRSNGTAVDRLEFGSGASIRCDNRKHGPVAQRLEPRTHNPLLTSLEFPVGSQIWPASRSR